MNDEIKMTVCHTINKSLIQVIIGTHDYRKSHAQGSRKETL